MNGQIVDEDMLYGDGTVDIDVDIVSEPETAYDFASELPKVRNFRDLLVWQRSMDLVESVFALTKAWRWLDQKSLGDQLRRAAVSVPSNIAEGQGRLTDAEFANRLRIAHGSLREVETQLLIAHRMGIGKQEDIDNALSLVQQTGQLMQGLMRALARKKV